MSKEAWTIALYALMVLAIVSLLALPALLRVVRMRRLQKALGSLYWRLVVALDTRREKLKRDWRNRRGSDE